MHLFLTLNLYLVVELKGREHKVRDKIALCTGKEDIPKPSRHIEPKNPGTVHKIKSHKSPLSRPNVLSHYPPTSPMPKPGHLHRTTPHHTNPLIWCLAVICTILAVAVIVGGVTLFIGYLAIKPKVPQISVSSAQLDAIYFDQASLLTVQVTIVIKSENNNAKASVSFYGTRFGLSFRGQNIAYLVASTYDLAANKTMEFNYVSQSTPIPLNPDEAEAVNWSLNRKSITFELKGNTKTRWRVGLIGSVKFWLHLNCMLQLPVNGTPIFPRCSSRSQ